MSDAVENAKQAAWRAAHDLAAPDSTLTRRLIQSAEMAVLRRLVSRQLANGEADFWKLVEEEIRR